VSLTINQYDRNGNFLGQLTVNVANPTKQTATWPNGPNSPPVLVSVPITDPSPRASPLDPNYSVSAPLHEGALSAGSVVISGGPAMVTWGNDPTPSENGIPVESSATLVPMGRRLAVL